LSGRGNIPRFGGSTEFGNQIQVFLQNEHRHAIKNPVNALSAAVRS